MRDNNNMTKSSIPWSYSSLTAFETCPRKFKLTRLTREVVEPPTEATTHGTDVHKALETYLLKGTALPDKYRQYLPLVERVTRSPGDLLVEYKFALTRSIKPTEFFAEDAWVRGVIDVCVVDGARATALDWKTGKPKPDGDQLKLFAAATMALFPQVDSVSTGYVWLAHKRLDQDVFHRRVSHEIWQAFLPRVVRLEMAEETDNYPPRPSGLCRKYCPLHHNQCEFSGKVLR